MAFELRARSTARRPEAIVHGTPATCIGQPDREEALSLLDAKLDKYRRMSYAELSAKIGDEEFPEAVGPSGTNYQIEIQIRWDHKPGGDVRVLGTIDDGTFRGAFKPVCSDLIVRPDKHDFDDE